VITYTPSIYFIGVDEFSYTISDGELADTAVVTVTVVDSGVVPVAVDDAYTATEDKTLVVPAETGLLANDLDPRGLGLTAQLISNPLNGTLELHEEGWFTYIPNPGFRGNDSFTYRVFDSVVYSLVADVVITVNAPGSEYKVYLPLNIIR
jgi:hypothetical protein